MLDNDVPVPRPSRLLDLTVQGLAAYLTLVEPARFAWVAASALSRIAEHGPAALMLLGARIGVTGLGIFAGRALRRGGDPRPTLVFLACSAVVVTVTALTPYFPANRLPGTKWPLLGLWLLLHVAGAVIVRHWARARSASARERGNTASTGRGDGVTRG